MDTPRTVLHLAQEGFCHGNLFLGRRKAITKWPGMCFWGGDGRFGETRVVLTRMANTRPQMVRARRQFLGRETGDCRKRGLVGRPKARPSRVRGVRKMLRPVRERAPEPRGRRRGCRREGSRVGVCWGSLGGWGRGPGDPGPPLYSQCREGRRI